MHLFTLVTKSENFPLNSLSNMTQIHIYKSEFPMTLHYFLQSHLLFQNDIDTFRL